MAHNEWLIPSPWSPAVQQGWQCPSCRRVYSPSMVMCTYCPAQPEAASSTYIGDLPGTTSVVNFIAKGHLGTPCPRPRDGGMCGCDEDDDTPPKVCLGRECDCV